MTINIQYVGMATSESMNAFVNEKLEKLAVKYEDIIAVEVYFENLNDPKGNGKVCKMEVSLPGPRVFAESDESNYELAAKNTISDLDVQLRKRKELLRAH